MNFGLILLVIYCVISTLITFVQSSNVKVLNPDNFDTIVNGDKYVLVEFYAPWCGHCKQLEPIYEQLADIYQKSPSVVIAKIDAEKFSDLSGKYKVSGFPTIKFFKKSTEPNDYSGNRQLEDFVQFINSETGEKVKVVVPPSFIVTLNPSNFDNNVLNPAKFSFVEFYAPWCGHCKSLAPIWENLARIYAGDSDKVLIANVDADKYKSLGEKNKVSGFPTLKFFDHANGPEAQDYTGGRTIKEFVDFVNSKTGIKRTVHGTLQPAAGRIDDIDLIFIDDAIINKDLLKKAEKIVANLKNDDDIKYGAIYIKAIKKIIKSGKVYIQKELTRLENLISSDSVNPKKKTQFMLRFNILNGINGLKLVDEEKPEEPVKVEL